MPSLIRQEIATTSDRVVIKVGTRVLTGEDGTLDESRVEALCAEFAKIVAMGKELVVVSSGAVGAGLGRLKIGKRPTDVATLQAVAAVGQSRLTEAYDRALRPYNLHAAQVLLIADDLDVRARYLNVRNTLNALFRFGAIPIINENDTVSVDELQISFGDNDRLAALVTNLLRAPLLILLSDVEGLYDRSPQLEGAKCLSLVEDLDAAIAKFESHSKQAGTLVQTGLVLSRGGMASKLVAARMATSAGENVIIASGKKPGALSAIFAGEEEGTLFLAKGRAVASRKRWIGSAAKAHGKLLLDVGAVKAVVQDGGSLLAVGIQSVQGSFLKGEIVSLCDANGKEIARGLCNYASEDVQKIAGHSTGDIASLLGHRPYDEVVHRDNLALN